MSSPLWSSGGFRRLWTVALLGAVSTWATQVALSVGVLAHHSGAALAAVLLAGNVPALLVGPLGGAVVDQVRPHVVLRVALPAQAVGLVVMAVAIGGSLVATAFGYAVFLIAGRFAGPAAQRLRYLAAPESLRGKANAAIGAVTGISTIGRGARDGQRRHARGVRRVPAGRRNVRGRGGGGVAGALPLGS
ncbi:MFS transporter [Allokutzneria sp. NRRL B-24872]|uniref:MFS transporter n=1 Tax=Allokutzneria sp. NRRL B-24872 TaxID=1137961 RepID=UPI0011788E62|nr:MFS transporter [Allokutzneria sp. NRRL B-24872]